HGTPGALRTRELVAAPIDASRPPTSGANSPAGGEIPPKVVATGRLIRRRARLPATDHAEQTASAVENVPGAAWPPSSTAAVHESALEPPAAGCPAASPG